jgi:hypothetical protein
LVGSRALCGLVGSDKRCHLLRRHIQARRSLLRKVPARSAVAQKPQGQAHACGQTADVRVWSKPPGIWITHPASGLSVNFRAGSKPQGVGRRSPTSLPFNVVVREGPLRHAKLRSSRGSGLGGLCGNVDRVKRRFLSAAPASEPSIPIPCRVDAEKTPTCSTETVGTHPPCACRQQPEHCVLSRVPFGGVIEAERCVICGCLQYCNGALRIMQCSGFPEG